MLTFAAEAMPELNAESVGMLKIALGVYIVFLLGLSIVASRRVKNEEDYLIAGRRLPLFLAWGTLMATWFGAATMFAAAESARDEGLRGVILDPFACAGTLVFAGLFFARPLWRMKLLTMADFYRQKYGEKAEILGASIQIPSYFAWIALQYTALSRILATYFQIPFSHGVLYSAAVTLIYTLVGGMWSVTLTDTLQIIVALFGLLVLAFTVFSQPELGDGSAFRGVSVMVEKLTESHPDHLSLMPGMSGVLIMGWIAAWATGLFGNIPGQDLQQRVFASKDEKTASRACILAGVLYFAFGLIPVSLGLASHVTHPELEGEPVAFLAGHYLSPGMLIVFVIAVVSMVVSTATSAVLAPATLLGHNLLNRLPALRERALLRDRLCVVLVSIGGVVLALQGQGMMELLDMALSIQLVALFIPVAMGIYGKPRGELSAVLAMSFGFTAWAIRFLTEQVFLPMPEHLADTYEYYHDYLGAAFPVESLRTAASYVAVIPEDFYGFGFCVFGYLLGQQILKRRES
jgi:solute:Na+ symporter, SSS family